MEPSNDASKSTPVERQPVPSVSKEKWLTHAKTKLARGYVLIVGGRKRANFFLPEKGYETCTYDSAKKLIKEGHVEAVGEHSLGTVYRLKPSAASAIEVPIAKKATEETISTLFEDDETETDDESLDE